MIEETPYLSLFNQTAPINNSFQKENSEIEFFLGAPRELPIQSLGCRSEFSQKMDNTQHSNNNKIECEQFENHMLEELFQKNNNYPQAPSFNPFESIVPKTRKMSIQHPTFEHFLKQEKSEEISQPPPQEPLFEFVSFDNSTEDQKNEVYNTNNSEDQNSNSTLQNHQVVNEKNIEFAENRKIFQISQKALKKKKQRDYDKNICRYLARQIIRCFVDRMYKQEVQNLCLQQNFDPKSAEKLYERCVKFMLGKIEFITGHRAFKELLCFNQDPEFVDVKNVFREFTCWFLKERAFRYILTGSMTNKRNYIKFKNEIMLFYAKKPESWNSNVLKNKKQ